MASFQYKIFHRPGKAHANADALSRLPAFVGNTTEASQTEAATVGRSLQGSSVCAVQEKTARIQAGQECVDDEIAKAQSKDVELQQLIQQKKMWLDSPEGSGLQKYAPVWLQLQMRNSRLVSIPPANSDAVSKVQGALPQALIPKVLAQLHDSPTGDHLGVQKLQGKVKDRFYWLGWFGDMKKWCR